MDVWVVEAGLDYEAHHATAVCSTGQKAEELREKWERDTFYDWVSVVRYTVDGHEPDYSGVT